MKIDVYMPHEDSRMLEKEVLEFARGSVLDMGTGSGIQAEAAASLKPVKKVLAVDISKEAVDFCRSRLKSRKIKVLKSDLFSKVPKQKFDTIVFNPPYLPRDKVKHPALDGGKKGHEVLERFLNQAGSYLADNGIMLIVFSSLTNQEKVNEIIRNNLLEFKLLNMMHFFFEKLFTYKIWKSGLLKELEKKRIREIKYLASGKRGVVFTGNYRGRKIAVKTKHPESMAQQSVENEAKMLKMLNKNKIGPRFIAKGKNYLIYEFVEGEYIKDWLVKARLSGIRKILKEVLRQCSILDRLRINKEEMHHPLKHIIIRESIVLIDFERAHKSKSLKNVTQFLQFIRSNIRELNKKGFSTSKDKILEISKDYKKHQKIDYVFKGLGL